MKGKETKFFIELNVESLKIVFEKFCFFRGKEIFYFPLFFDFLNRIEEIIVEIERRSYSLSSLYSSNFEFLDLARR